LDGRGKKRGDKHVLKRRTISKKKACKPLGFTREENGLRGGRLAGGGRITYSQESESDTAIKGVCLVK